MLGDHKSLSKIAGATLITLLTAFPSAIGYASLETGLTDVSTIVSSSPTPTNMAPGLGQDAYRLTRKQSSTADLVIASLRSLPAGPGAPAELAATSTTEPFTAAKSKNSEGEENTISDYDIIGQLSEIRDSDARKSTFIGIVEPAIEEINASILSDRQEIIKIRAKVASGTHITTNEHLWLGDLASKYKTNPDDFDELLKRVDIVPASLALSQAAIESGWGTSSLAKRQLALFGQIAGDGFAAFDSLNDGIFAYITNLNTHRAYDKFRSERATERSNGEDPDGYHLAKFLSAYSELGNRYVTKVRSIMKSNDLAEK